MTNNRIVVVAMLVLCSCGAFQRPPEPPKDFKVYVPAERYGLANGVGMFVLPVPGSKLVQLDVRYTVGSAQDPPGKAGMAHLAEHLMFEIKIGDAGETAGSMLGRLAHSYNAFTNHDSTHYVARLDKKHLDDVMGVYTFMVQTKCEGLDEATFVREREVVRNEIRQDHARAAGEIPRLLLEAAYGKRHPYGHSIGGDDAQIASVTREEACAFIDKHYIGPRATFLVAGDVTAKRARELAGKLLKHIATVPRPPTIRPRHVTLSRRKIITHELDIDEPQLYVMWALPETYSRKGLMARMVHEELRGIVAWFASTYSFANNVRSTIIGGARAPVAVLSMSLPKVGKMDEALSMIKKSVNRLPREFGDEPRFGGWTWRAKNEVEGLLANFELLGERTGAFADFGQFDPRGGFLIGALKTAGSIDNKALRSLSESLFRPDDAVVVLVKPRAGATGYMQSDLSFSGRMHDGDRGIEVDAADAKKSLPLPSASAFRRQVQRYTLANGLSVVLWPDAELPLVRATMLMHTGDAHEPDGWPGIAGVAAGELGAYTTDDFTTSHARHLSYDAHDASRVAEDFVRHYIGSIDKLRARTKKQLSFKGVAKRREFAQRMLSEMYGAGHPYAVKGFISLKSIKKIDRDSSNSFTKKHYVASNSTLIMTGQFDVELIKRHIAFTYGHWSEGKPDASVTQSAKKRKTPGRVLVDSGQSPVTQVRVMYAGGLGVDDSYAARQVLATMLSARLRKLREQRALTYGMSAAYSPRRGPGRWSISGSVDSKRVGEAVRALQEQIKSLHTMDEAFAADFVLARRKLMENYLAAGNDGYSIGQRLLFIAQYGLPGNFYKRYGTRLANLRPADVKAILDTELADSQQVLGLFGPANAISAAR